jgi:hypothetical protein
MGAGRYIITSCEPDQKAYEANGRGFFTASLIEQLRKRQGCVRLREVFAAVQTDVSNRAMAAVKLPQRPVLASSDDAAEIILGAGVDGTKDGCVIA